MKEIKLTKGLTAYIDDTDIELVGASRWYSHANGCGKIYARAMIGGKLIYMHRLLVNAKKGLDVDHINGNPLDNRRENLRQVTRQENLFNGRMKKKTGFKGVYAYGKRWISYISFNRKNKYLGSFGLEEDAARAYDKAANELFGKFARPNFKPTAPAV